MTLAPNLDPVTHYRAAQSAKLARDLHQRERRLEVRDILREIYS